MFLGFNLKIDDFVEFNSYEKEMKRKMEQLDERCSDFLEQYKDEKNTSVDVLDASKIMAEWFPEYSKAQIFISYSSDDCANAQKIAGFLEQEFGLNVFIDSLLWGHCNELLKAIDGRYCWNKTKHLYDYNLRNSSTSHVHNMVCTSLMRMIDQCECIMLLNTDHSITSELTPDNVIKNTSFSPWIYYELETMNYIQKRIPPRQISTLKHTYESATELSEQVMIQYPVKLDNLTRITSKDLWDWKKKYEISNSEGSASSEKALDILYASYVSKYEPVMEDCKILSDYINKYMGGKL